MTAVPSGVSDARAEAMPSGLEKRMPGLDGIRGAAIGLVLLYHFSEYQRSYAIHDPQWLAPAVRLFNIGSNMGWIGVQLFFVLSGFLITGILADTKEAPGYFRTFYGRRAVRILPAYYAVLLFHLLVLSRLSLPDWAHLRYVVAHQAWYWTFTTNFLFMAGGWHRLTSHFWTLAVEEQFYLVWPLVVWALSVERLMRVCVLAVVGGIALHVAFFLAGVPARDSYLFTPTELDGLAVGAFLALSLRRPASMPFAFRHWRALTIGAAIALCGLILVRHGLSFEDPYVPLIGFTAMAVVFGALTFAAATANPDSVVGTALRNPLLRFLGRYSYAIYLLHMPIIQLWASPQRGESWLVGDGVPPFLAHLSYIIVVTMVIVAASLISWYVIERPFLRLRPSAS